MLAVDVVTIFPRMFAGLLDEGIAGRAVKRTLARVDIHDLRGFTDDPHRCVDDRAFGGGPGMVLKAEPFFRAVEFLLPHGSGHRDAVVLLSPRGEVFDQAAACRLAKLDRLVLLCGRYEGVDERVSRGVATEELSLGDYVLTGGEAAALVVIEATLRLLPDALGDAGSAAEDSFSDGLLDFPHYTRPARVRGLDVPPVLISGDHERVRRWRRKEALRVTLERRPDLLGPAPLNAEDHELLEEIQREQRVAG